MSAATIKLRWQVSAPATGRYASFQPRGWPTAAWSDGSPAAAVFCADPYRPRAARMAEHRPLRLQVADHSARTDDGRPTFKWLVTRATYASLDEAKQAAVRILTAHPEWHPAAEQQRRPV